ncbi:dienelactone hydrolase family protein [Brevibacterium atlanticum]|uniref:dienelactone hydrolase family protein n=1 Tax=Brevibacterium atlanticum TaxID=2697563 RepID=UPI001421A521|nr:dienelactone hydrolase family protein [Brevibacterium atlanticum]
MAEVLLYHHIQGLTDGVSAFAEDLRQQGHTVHTPDLFGGRTFASIEDGFAFAKEVGFDVLRDKGLAAVDGLGADLVYAGFSYGVMTAQQLAQTRPGARGALLLHSCAPVSEFGQAWPDGVPVQIHGMDGDEFFDEDLPAARELAESTSSAELFVYPGDEHLFTDSSLEAFDADAAALVRSRVHAFLQDL